MINTKKRLIDRVLAVYLSILMVISILPLSGMTVNAATDEYEDVFTFTVTDGEEPIQGAIVTITNEIFDISLEKETDENGVAAFDEFTELESELELEEALICDYTVSVAGYEIETGTISSLEDGWSGNIDVILTAVIPEIEISDEDFEIIPYSANYDGEAHDAVTVTAEDFIVTFSEDNDNYTDQVPQIQDAGSKTIFVKLERIGYISRVVDVTAIVNPIKRNDFAFDDPSPIDLEYSDGLTYSNPALTELEPQVIEYTSSEEEIATVDDSGTVTFIKAGTVTITAKMAASTNYVESEASYTITVNTAPRTSFGFVTTAPSNITYSEGLDYINEAINLENDGIVSYEIVSQMRDGYDVTGVAELDPENPGRLIIYASGTVVIRATVTEGDFYKGASAEYTLVIDRAEQSEFAFTENEVSNLPYNETYQNVAYGGTGSGEITYEIVSGDDIISLEDDGTIKAIGVGEAIIKATKGADERYNAIDVLCTVKTIKANQSGFAFERELYTTYYGISNQTVLAQGGQTNGSILYSVESGDEIGCFNDPASGVITFFSAAQGTMIIKAVKSGDEHYNDVDAYCTVEVQNNDFSGDYMLVGDEGENGWYIGNVKITPNEGYQISTSNEFDAEWKEQLTIEAEGLTQFGTFYLKKIDDGRISDPINNVPDIYIDKTNPVDLEIEYSKSIIDIVLETITFGAYESGLFGFYDTKMQVTITATDIVSGIDYFVYNIGDEDIVITNDQISKSGNVATATFNIEAQYRGKVSFTAYDTAGRKTSLKDEKEIVVDNVAPNVWVEYDNNDVINTNYYTAERTATIYIDESNFFEKNLYEINPSTGEKYLVITIGKRVNKHDDYVFEEVELPFSDEDEDGIYTATYLFNEDADYTFDVKFTDFSGNVWDEYARDEFTIDKTNPVVTVRYSNDDVLNGKYYKDEQRVTIIVHERNFNAADIRFTVEAVDVQGNSVDVSEKNYEDFIHSQANWTEENDDFYTIEITFDIDANYSLDISYSDMSGRGNELASYHDEFVIDQMTETSGAPYDLEIDYSKSVLDTILEAISFGFYRAPVTVTVTAKDDIAGVDYFTYSYTVQESSSSINEGKANIQLDVDSYTDKNKKAIASFEIPAQFRGYVSFTATDMAGNESELLVDEKIIVVDDVAPEIKVTFDNNSAKYSSYFNSTRTATIEINEANFFSQDIENIETETINQYLIITVGKTLNDGTHTEERIQPEFTKSGDKYTATVFFGENADYTFSVEYTDPSGNHNTAVDYGNSVSPTRFTVDLIDPIIQVDYDNQPYLNGNQFKTNRTATITITEHNFNSADVAVNIAATGGNSANIPDYAANLKKASSWTSQGDVHKATILFETEANYTFDIAYTDMSGRKNASVNYGNSIAPTRFTIDKTIPTASIQVGSWTQSLNGTRWDHFLSSYSFGLWTNKAVKVSVQNNDSLSGVDIVEHFRSSEILTLAQVKAYTNWTSVSNTKRSFDYTVNPDEQFIVYVHIVDKAGNELYLSSDGIIVDQTLPEVESIAPEITLSTEQTINEIYNGDVSVDVRVVDPIVNNVYSGLSSITYRIYNNSVSTTEPTQSGTLFDFTNSIPQKSDLVQIFDKTGCITIDSKLNNSNDVLIVIEAIDNSGNKTTKTCSVKIDITAPTIDITYSNNDADSASFFKADRTATVVVTERNFNPDDVQITITNTDGVIPSISTWTRTAGTGNGDNTRWIATITYNADGDYTFDISYTDLAANVCNSIEYGDSAAPTEFTIDKTLPVIGVVYDNNDAENINYFKAERTATITIREHNFNSERVNITLTATDDGVDVTIPTVSGWTSNGDVHTATIKYANDALYSFDISFNDMAGNAAEDFAKQTFYVDKTNPSLSITGVENNSANNGDVIPVISFSDTNYDSNSVTITLVGANRGKIDILEGTYTDIHNGRIFTFDNFAKELDVDDIYTLTIRLTDMAGNTTTEEITFSVNRFGSNYIVSDATKDLNGKYVKTPQDVVITEINANELEDITITLFKNNETITLVEGEDYIIDIIGGNGEWYQYTYTILSKNFEDDGVYRLTVHSKDAAGNVAENTLDTKGTEISFGVDKTNPTLVVTNLESDTTYAVDSLSVIMLVNDNLLLDYVAVYVDDYETAYKIWNADEIAEIIAGNGEFTFDIWGDSTSAHRVKIVCIDSAGNETVEEITDFYVTTNVWVRYYNNKPLFFGSIGGVVLLIALVVFLIVWKKQKKERR